MIDTETLWRSYTELLSVWKVAERHGLCGQTVHERFKRAGLKLNNARWAPDEDDRLRALYEAAGASGIDLIEVAKQMGRSKAAVACRANELDLTDMARAKTTKATAAMAVRMKQQWQTQPHPRGMAGKTHSNTLKANMAALSKQRWQHDKATATGLMSPEMRQKRSDSMSERRRTDPRLRSGYSRGAMGRRGDLGGLFFRSSWEANYARYLNMLKIDGKIWKWEFEPDTFWFEKIKRGVRSYLPDFKVWETEASSPYYVEVKGWMDAKSKTKLKRMKLYYPDIKVELVDQKRYKILEQKYAKLISGWEFGRGQFTTHVQPVPDWLEGQEPKFQT